MLAESRPSGHEEARVTLVTEVVPEDEVVSLSWTGIAVLARVNEVAFPRDARAISSSMILTPAAPYQAPEMTVNVSRTPTQHLNQLRARVVFQDHDGLLTENRYHSRHVPAGRLAARLAV